MKKLAFETRAIHAGQTADPVTGAVMTPIYATSTYKQSAPGVHQGYEYSRTQNPTRQALEDCIASLEEGKYGFAFASGMAAIDTVINLLDHGSHVVAMNDLYGGTFRLFDKIKTRTQNLTFSFIDLTNLDNLEKALRPETKLIWLETPTNPMLKVVDLAAIAKIAKAKGIITVVDNTFATPYLQTPLTLDCDIVVHSGTKYLNGHSDTLCGFIVVKEEALAEKIHFLQNGTGGILSPLDSFMVLRGLKTLPVRMERHCDNAERIVEWLSKQPQVKKVYYPSQHAVAKKQMKRFGGMISVAFDFTLEQTKMFLSHCQLFTLAESLGGVESLIEHPALMTHASVPQENRLALGITDGFVRLSVGIEHPDDLIADLQHALKETR